MTPPPLSGDAKAYVYLLKSRKDGKCYLGWTTDLLRRLGEHNDGLNCSTKNRGPFKIIHFETFVSPENAKKREGTLKKNPRMYSLFKKRASLCSPVSLTRKEVVG